MSSRIDVYEKDDDALCACGHAFYLHDDGEAACLDCNCQKFREPQPSLFYEEEARELYRFGAAVEDLEDR